MVDERSTTTRVKLAELDARRRRLARLLARFEGCLNDAADRGKKSLSIQYDAAGHLAEKKLETFIRGVEQALDDE